MEDYFLIVKDIINNEYFTYLKQIEQHGTTRYNHSMRVSYLAYMIAKFIHLDYKRVARAGVLHDFHYTEDFSNRKERFISMLSHSKKAVSNSLKHFDLSDMEKDIIKTHMFPINLYIPKYSESWIVNISDKLIAIDEFKDKYKYKIKNKLYFISNIVLFLIIGKF